MNAQTAKPTRERLLAQAHVLFKKTGLTPYQLADQRAELLEALRVVVADWTEQFESNGHLAPSWCRQARAAIQRATGEQP